ncbi:MAG: TonB-dependent hemoglobin/transferrin/lactoferrin family receptor [Pasteurellaceae bacterium]|nr:TonB-dependent hemoglobin/transferrin/lactoferrin family receptor [Pasteurellaceae bacterium]
MAIKYKFNIIHKTLLLSCISITALQGRADELNQIDVEDSLSEATNHSQAIIISKKTIQKELINDSRDLVRYTTNVGISDNGRHLKGFAMRGVEGNRVGISIDGVSIPDSEENSLYSRYGNFNSSRLGIDSELVSGIDLIRGSDSFSYGSGALGGVVNYRTLNASDIVLPDHNVGIYVKNGYASKNREWVHTTGLGYQDGKLEAVLLYSNRRGHELKSNGNNLANTQNPSATGIPDPAKHTNNSYLAKLSYLLNEKHRFSLSYNQQKSDNNTNELSYVSYGNAWREANDIGKRRNLNLAYEYFPSHVFSYAKIDFDWMKTDVAAVNYKGSGEGHPLDEIYDRRMKTQYKRLNFHLDSIPLQWGGEHTFSLRAFASQRDFENINQDTINISLNQKSGKAPDIDNYTIQYPMRTIQYHFSLQDQIRWNDIFSSIVGLAYDHTKIRPRDLNAKCSKACTTEGKPGGAKFNNWSGLIQLSAQLNPTWNISYQLSTGYRVPTASEMYFTFDNPYGKWQSNPNLKAERSINHAISLQGRSEKGNLMLNLYQTNYRNFLFEQENIITQVIDYCSEDDPCPRSFDTPKQQMVNIDKARIRGIEINANYQLNGLIHSLPDGLKLFGSLGYSKGKLSSESSLLSIQPIKAIIGLDYEDPNGKWGVFTRLTYLGAKKPKDAKVTENNYTCIERRIVSEDDEEEYWGPIDDCAKRGYVKEVKSYKWLNHSAFTFDIFGYYHPFKNLTLRAGVYNLFNQRYHTWDALRGINAHSTTNSVDAEGKGLQRFYAPGRNYAASIELRF